jgi:hypothetical protein
MSAQKTALQDRVRDKEQTHEEGIEEDPRASDDAP